MNRYNCTIITSDECINNGNCKVCEYGEIDLNIGDKIKLVENFKDWITNLSYFEFTKEKFPECFDVIEVCKDWYKIKYGMDIFAVNKMYIKKYFEVSKIKNA